MKFSHRLLIATLAISSPLLASAQSATPGLTREQVRNEMIQYKAAGFNPARANPGTWVNDAQAASAKVASARNSANPQLAENGSSSQCN
ncbi:DUF4148 domain-containing protein [Burkholderia pseudomultivorans]|uniref:DUF4148 domain-containing protein n=1 Tax=Burkholderia pseudomultivorans TaxID=1207504 RepID=UPI0003168D40|nr:DUF4148 domain-containing protein [Burkholderia pseudomultivorans]AOI93772.1 hypothetical protein WS57_14550 [Burkholderia pseudomultivorans]KVC24522.1 hypothetical protein WS55_17695 [Burkholderia pseudomultivorans]KVC25461.1 hypothetical protein WS56_28050 [Burkholderia pseudomultivorans]KVC45547.1 hypothetical protein WS58_13520 [Burkholderia pseudomultivorans]MDS0795225.1 DUF4148 domain-containing protein [Burkholderia pseudomultivorans]